MPFQIIPYFFITKGLYIEYRPFVKWSLFSSPHFSQLCGKQESKGFVQMCSVTT